MPLDVARFVAGIDDRRVPAATVRAFKALLESGPGGGLVVEWASGQRAPE